MKGTWDFYQDQADEWRWRLTASNGKIIGAANEGYKHKMDCIDNAIRHGYGNQGNVEGKSLGLSDKWEFYQDNADKWRWRRKASNGQNVGSSTEGYANKADCIANAVHLNYKES